MSLSANTVDLDSGNLAVGPGDGGVGGIGGTGNSGGGG